MNNDAAVQSTPVCTEFPYEVTRVVHDVVVADGTRLSVKTWVPQGVTTGVVLEAIPYRKDDVSLVDDEARFSYLAGNGIACARMDLRGSGSSDGVLVDEYTRVEQHDIEWVIEWLAGRPWCNGAVGMVGISWSGINALQLAARRPRALKAIITTCSSDDRYHNDVHYLGGVPLAFYMNLWGSALRMMNMRPPKPEQAGPDWLSEWTTRLHANIDVTSLWLAHPARDAYWQQAAVRDDYSSIDCGVLLVGGWADNYTDTVFRALEALPAAKAVVGPWGHTWPERPWPGSGIDFLGLSLRWWQHWLLGVDNGVPDDPRLRMFIEDSVPGEDTGERRGRWMATNDPRSAVDERTFALGTGGRLGVPAPVGSTVTHQSELTVGTRAGHPLPMGVSTDLPGRQDTDDDRSVTFQTEPLAAPVSILGNAAVRLTVASAAATGHLFVRITDVDGDGRSHLVTRGALNLTHRNGHGPGQVAPMVPGDSVEIEIPLKAAGYRFGPGHRIRLALSTNYWPWLWPAVDQAAITISLHESSLVLPVLESESDCQAPVDLGAPVIGPVPVVESSGSASPSWDVESSGDGWTLVRRNAGGATQQVFDNGWTIEYVDDRSEYAIREGDQHSARMSREMEQRYSSRYHDIRLHLATVMTGDRDNFIVGYNLRAFVNGKLHYSNESTTTIPRGL